MGKIEKTDLPRTGSAQSDAEFNKMARELERQPMRATPDGKHNRYPRIADNSKYRERLCNIFGEKTVDSPGRTVYRYGAQESEAETSRRRFRENIRKVKISTKPAIGFRKKYS